MNASPIERRRRAQSLRIMATDAEQKLWLRLNGDQLGVRFNRQKPLGHYFADFYCHAAQLVVEVDGAQHFTPQGLEYDARRDAFMRARGLEILRFDDRQVLLETNAVVEAIWSTVQSRVTLFQGSEGLKHRGSISPNPSLKRSGSVVPMALARSLLVAFAGIAAGSRQGGRPSRQ